MPNERDGEQNNEQEQNASFQVMPTVGAVSDNEDSITETNAEVTESENTSSSPDLIKKLLYYGLPVLLLVIIAAMVYFIFGRKNQNVEEQNVSKLPKVWLKQYFNVEECTNLANCGDSADPDNDGLGNYQEFQEGTNPIDNDSDDDGLADGDEVNIYKTKPTLKYTDRRNVAQEKDFNDGVSIRNKYDPLTPGLKFTTSRKNQIENDINKFSLHEPTVTTLNTIESKPQTYTVFIVNNQFTPETVQIKVEDTIIWVNNDDSPHKIASDPHPTHINLPGLVSDNLSKSQTFSFKFDHPGVYGYHDHLNPNTIGIIEVK